MFDLVFVKTQVLTYLAQNQFLTGGAILGFVGAGFAYSRYLPYAAWELFERYFLYRITLESSDPIFHGFSQKFKDLSDVCHSHVTKTIRESSYDNINDSYHSKFEAKFEPINDARLLKIAGVWCWFSSSRTKSENGERSSTNAGDGREINLSPDMFLDSYSITTFGKRNIEKVKDFIKSECTDFLNSDSAGKLQVFTLSGYGWKLLSNPDARKISTVNLPYGMAEEIVDDARKFFEAKSWYVEKGVPHRRGFLLYGKPGNGKSSLVSALATELKLNLYICPIKQVPNDAALISAMSNVGDRSIILIEDIDALVKDRDAVSSDKGSVGLSFAGLLNAIDGVAAQTGSLLIMTTNHVEKLDPALIRPGRIDRRFEFKNANFEQCRDIFLRFFNDDVDLATKFAEKFGNESYPICAIQEHLLRYRDSAKIAVSQDIEFNFEELNILEEFEASDDWNTYE